MTDYGLSGKTAVIAGGSGLIGAGISEVLAENGCDLVLGYQRDQNRAESLVQNLRAAYGVQAQSVRTDVAEEGGAERLFDCADKLGGADILVCALGHFQSRELKFVDMNLQWFESFYRDNLDAVFYLYRAFARHVRGRKTEGNVVTVVEIPPVNPGENGRVAYGMVKESILALTKTFAAEAYSYGIRVNAVLPGFVEGTRQYDKETMENRSLAGRYASPREIGNACAFLCSDASAFSIGTVLDVSGGRKF